MSTHFFNKAGVVIIKAHTPGANRKIILILDRYLANSSYENNNSYPI